jgi:alkyldihydroxyacetonephosphate synthase
MQDMHEMNNIKWIDSENMLVCMEAGIVGQDLKRRLEAHGLTIGIIRIGIRDSY